MVVPAALQREARALRRIALLLDRVRQDCGSRHPELSQIAGMVERLYARACSSPTATAARAIGRDLQQLDGLVDALNQGLANCDGGTCDLVRIDLIAELDELRQRMERQQEAVREVVVASRRAEAR